MDEDSLRELYAPELEDHSVYDTWVEAVSTQIKQRNSRNPVRSSLSARGFPDPGKPYIAFQLGFKYGQAASNTQAGEFPGNQPPTKKQRIKVSTYYKPVSTKTNFDETQKDEVFCKTIVARNPKDHTWHLVGKERQLFEEDFTFSRSVKWCTSKFGEEGKPDWMIIFALPLRKLLDGDKKPQNRATLYRTQATSSAHD